MKTTKAILYNGKEVEGSMTTSEGHTGIPPGRKVFRITDGKEYYPEQLQGDKDG